MAITQTLCNVFKQDCMLGQQNLTGGTIKMALYTASANLGADTTSYTATGEATPDYTVNAAAVLTGLAQASVSTEPGNTLFKLTTVGGRALGDINNSGSITSADTAAYNGWAAGTNTNAAQVAWITGTLNPYMFANPVTYAAYLTGTGANSGYTTGGNLLTGATVSLSGSTAYANFANAVWPLSAITARGALIYNSSNGKAIAVLDFGSDKTSSGGDFTVQFPANNVSNALIRLT